jgi:hypothetical protein
MEASTKDSHGKTLTIASTSRSLAEGFCHLEAREPGEPDML